MVQHGGSRDEALARLAGLNVLWAFDVEGKGTIDPVVFGRVLKRFDPEIFTDESIGAVISSMSGEGSTGKIEIANFAKMVKEVEASSATAELAALSATASLVPALARPATASHAPLLVPKSPKCSKHAVVLDTYVEGLVCDLEEFREAVDPESLVASAGDSPEELASLKQKLSLKAKEYVLQAQRKNIRPVWDAFDRDKDGELSPQECNRLVSAYLKALAPKIEEVVKGTVELGVELQVMLFEKVNKDPEARRKMRQMAQKQVDAVYPKVAQVARETLERMALEDPDVIAKDLLEGIDVNGDGKVTQDEFEMHFVEAIQQLLGPDRMVDKMQRAGKR